MSVLKILLLLFLGGSTIVMKLEPLEFKGELDAGREFMLLDVRSAEDYGKSRISRAVWAGNTRALDSVLTSTTLETPLFVYCERGHRSKEVILLLSKRKVKQIYELEGGFLAWVEQGLPLDSKAR
jgi:rhodanese-related sulfurtransferase